MDSKDINERRRGDLDKFLTATNTKAAVFRDIIIESGMNATCRVYVIHGGGTRFQRRTHVPPTDRQRVPQTAADGEIRPKHTLQSRLFLALVES